MRNYDINIQETKFAPAERLSQDIIKEQYLSISDSGFFIEIFSQIPVLFLLLNEKRQIVYSNQLLIKALGYEGKEDVLGLRPGEIFRCIHSNKEQGGCGTSEHCSFCGAVRSVLESQKTGLMITKEARILTENGDSVIGNDFEITSKPFEWKENNYYIVTMKDISSSKRKEYFERLFFHDIMNKAGSINGLINILDIEDANDAREIVDIIKRGTKELISDINFQKSFNQAENNELEISPCRIDSFSLLDNLKNDFKSYETYANQYVVIDSSSENFNFETDPLLLSRVLTNLIKNALEASNKKDIVKISSSIIDDMAVFEVHNPSVMSKETKKQIFQRSFSTKGVGRGLGTYSVKLFTEGYFKGKVEFDSDKDTGTIFRVILPRIIES